MAEAARRLDIDQKFTKGVAVGLGISMHPIGGAFGIAERDFERIKRHLSKTTYPTGSRAGRQLTAAST